MRRQRRQFPHMWVRQHVSQPSPCPASTASKSSTVFVSEFLRGMVYYQYMQEGHEYERSRLCEAHTHTPSSSFEKSKANVKESRTQAVIDQVFGVPSWIWGINSRWSKIQCFFEKSLYDSMANDSTARDASQSITRIH